jgi:hypothetical protein
MLTDAPVKITAPFSEMEMLLPAQRKDICQNNAGVQRKQRFPVLPFQADSAECRRSFCNQPAFPSVIALM